MRRIVFEICCWAVVVLCLSTAVRAGQAPVKVLFPGNWADPTVVEVGEDYYLASNSDRKNVSAYCRETDGIVATKELPEKIRRQHTKM